MKVSLLLKWGLFGVPTLPVIHDGGVTFLRRDTLNARKPWHFFIISSQLLNIKQSSSQSQMRGPISCNRRAGGQLGGHQTRFLERDRELNMREKQRTQTDVEKEEAMALSLRVVSSQRLRGQQTDSRLSGSHGSSPCSLTLCLTSISPGTSRNKKPPP